MAQRANLVMELIEELRKLSLPDDPPISLPATAGLVTKKEAVGMSLGLGPGPGSGSAVGERPPKRPWEDVVDDMPVRKVF